MFLIEAKHETTSSLLTKIQIILYILNIAFNYIIFLNSSEEYLLTTHLTQTWPDTSSNLSLGMCRRRKKRREVIGGLIVY